MYGLVYIGSLLEYSKSMTDALKVTVVCQGQLCHSVYIDPRQTVLYITLSYVNGVNYNWNDAIHLLFKVTHLGFGCGHE